VSGRIVHALQNREGWTLKEAYHTIFWMYSAMGIVNLALTLCMSTKCEAHREPEGQYAAVPLHDQDEASEDEDRVPQPATIVEVKKANRISLIAQISGETRWIMYRFWFLQMVDCLADGMTPYSLTNYYMDQKFHLKKSTLGDITSASYFLAAASTLFAGPLARLFGLINTMVFTHLPSSAAVLLFPLPNNLPMTVILLLIRTGLNNMDQAPRSAFIAAVVKPNERTAVMGITGMLRTVAAAVGPSITGLLAGNDRFWIAFVIAGSLRIAYDVGLWAMFVNMKLYKHEGGAVDADRASTSMSVMRASDEEEMTELDKL